MVEWRAIPGFDGDYEASEEGDIRRATPGAKYGGGAWIAGRILKQATTREGYRRVGLWVRSENRQRGFYVHRLIARAFIGQCPLGHTVNHLDGVKVNNRPPNLEYATKSQNYRHALDVLGFQPPRGDAHWNAKKNPEIVREIRRRVASGETQTSVARGLGLPRSNVSLIVSRKSWAHVDP